MTELQIDGAMLGAILIVVFLCVMGLHALCSRPYDHRGTMRHQRSRQAWHKLMENSND